MNQLIQKLTSLNIEPTVNMTPQLWSEIQHFNPSGSIDNFGDPLKMKAGIILLIDIIRDPLHFPIIINCGYESVGHSATGFHPKGLAVDFHFKTFMPFYYQIHILAGILETIEVSDSVGLGIYTQWNNPGFHLDYRGEKARWAKINNKYVGFDEGIEFAKKVRSA